MKEQHFFYVPQAASANELPEEEAQHALRVLRVSEGDEIMLMDGQGTFHRAEVTLTTGKRCVYSIVESIAQGRQWVGHLHIAVAPTKNIGRMEWMVEKCTEIGIDELTFLACRYSERKVIKEERMEKIVVSAVKQSRKAWKPVINGLTPFSAFIARPRSGQLFIAHCMEDFPRAFLFDALRTDIDTLRTGAVPTPNAHDITVLIGPEGDFSEEEVQAAIAAGYASVHLGKSRLRTETAALSVLMMLHLSVP